MKMNLEEILGVESSQVQARLPKDSETTFSLLFFSDVRHDVTDIEKYRFMRDIAVFGDDEGFEAIYLPERHFHEFGSIYANSAVAAAYIIAQTKRIRIRTAGISLPLHHPAEIVEWWAMNDVLSGGRVDLGFGSGWNRDDFVFAPDQYQERKRACSERIPIIQKLWRGEPVSFPGPDGDDISLLTYPRPIQNELNVWLLIAQNDEAFIHAGQSGYNVFTMLYGIDFSEMEKKIRLYRRAREEAGYPPETGIVTLMLHTLVHENSEIVAAAVEKPFRNYIASSMKAHLASGHGKTKGVDDPNEQEKKRILDYAFERYYRNCAIFGSVGEAQDIVDRAIAIGVNDIACLMDFGVDYELVKESFGYLKKLVSKYR